MFLQSIPKLDETDSSFVLISSSPHNDWKKYAQKYWNKIDSKKSDNRELVYKVRRNSENYRLLCASWANYYFLKEKIQYGEKLLLKESNDFQLYDYVNNLFLKTYKTKWNNWNKVFFITGEFDYVTPFEIFNDYEFEGKHQPKIVKIRNAGHLPWIENFENLRKILKQISKI